MTDPFEGVTPDLPVLRDYDGCAYYKEDAGKILLGAFEPDAKPWGMDGIPEDFCFDQLPDDFEHFEPVLMHALKRMPALADAGIQTFFCGPESFTPDDRYHLGEAPGRAGCYVAAGFNSIGIQSAGGAGKVLAECIETGKPLVDMWDVDIRRNLPFQTNRRYLRERVGETLGLLYDDHWPFRQYATARGVRRSPFHDRLAARGACHGEAFGWERPNWYATDGMEPRYEYSFGRQNWFDASAEEHHAVREGVGLFDQTSFAKFRLQGRDAAHVLGRVCANAVDVPPGRIVYTPMAQRDWRHRGRPDRDPARRRRFPDRDVRRVPGAGRPLAPAPHTGRRARGAHRCDLGHRRARRHGSAFARPAAVSEPERPRQRGLPLRHQPGDRARPGIRARRPHHPTWASSAGSSTSRPSSRPASTMRWWKPGRPWASATSACTP